MPTAVVGLLRQRPMCAAVSRRTPLGKSAAQPVAEDRREPAAEEDGCMDAGDKGGD